MKYLVIGAGGTGGPVAGFLKKGGTDVAVIARGEHLKAIKEKGLTIKKSDGSSFTVDIDAFSADEYNNKADVIFLCVKSYSLDSTVDIIKNASHKDTVVIPLLNIYTTGEYLSKKLPELLVTDGCIYIASSISEYGTASMNGEIFRVLFGVRNEDEDRPVLKEIAKEMRGCRILAEKSKDIRKSALEKYSFVSPMASCGVYHNCKAEKMQKDGAQRDMFVALVKEIIVLANSMGIDLPDSLVERNLKIMDDLNPDATTSMQRDIEKGKESEISGLIHIVAEKSRENNLGLVTYEKISKFLKEKNL